MLSILRFPIFFRFSTVYAAMHLSEFWVSMLVWTVQIDRRSMKHLSVSQCHVQCTFKFIWNKIGPWTVYHWAVRHLLVD